MVTDGDSGPEYVLADYKTASPGKEKEAVRQMSLYVYLVEKLMEQRETPINIDFMVTLYMIKKAKPAKPRVPFHQTKLDFQDLRVKKDLVKKNIIELEEDINQINECLDKGVFFKNRKSDN
jgi:hypothetical protein